MDALPPPEPSPAVIVVTGRALPDPAAERGYSVETIDRDRLTHSPAHRLEEILEQVPGLQLFRRSDAGSGHPTSQGVTLRALGGNASSRALLILDGVPQADTFGGWVNWPAFDPQSLEAVRVVRGGGSVAYGPGALAGLIEMNSFARERSDAAIDVGSRSSVLGSGHLGLDTGTGLVTLDVRGSRSQGFVPVTEDTRGPADERAPFREGSARARWIAPIGSAVELQASGLAFVDRRERGLPFTENRTRGADLSLRLVGSGRWQWSAVGYAQWRSFRSSFASVNEDRTVARRVSLQDAVPSDGHGLSVEVRPPMPKGIELRLGGDARRTDGESRELFSYVGDDPTRRRIAGGRSATGGIFAEASWSNGPLTLSGGGRIDRWAISDGILVERVIATGAATRNEQYPDRHGWRPTARGAALLDVGAGFSLRSAAYFGWRLPTLNELFRPFRVGADATAANPLLSPERLGGIEAGMRYGSKRLDLSVTAFVNRLSDSIANVTLGHGPGVFPGVGFVAGTYRQRRNIDAIRVRGLEADAQVRRGPWSARFGLAYNDARVRGSALQGLRPAQTPRFTFTTGLGWQDGARSASLVVRHSGRQFEDDLNQRSLPAATTVDGFFSWPVSRRLQFVARGENLLDETVVAGVGEDGTVERATPRTIWLGLRFSG